MQRCKIALVVIGGFAAASPGSAADWPWTVEAGVAIVKVEGVRSYAIPERKLAQNDTPHVTARSVRISRTLWDHLALGLAYTHYNELRGSGASPNSDLFDRGGVNLPAVIPLEITDEIDEMSLDGRWRWTLQPNFTLSGGPVLSYFDSRGEWGSSSFVSTIGSTAPPQRVFTRRGEYHQTDLRLGGVIGMAFGVTTRAAIEVDYRYATSPRRDLHLASAGLRWLF